MTNYELIKAAAQKANPDLMKLSFGCVLEDVDGCRTTICKRENRGNAAHDYLSTTEGQIFVESIYSEAQEQIKSGNITQNNFGADVWKILGHEPQLFDIKVMLEYNGYEIGERFLDIVRNWTYPAGLSNQSEQTLNLILPYVQKNGE